MPVVKQVVEIWKNQAAGMRYYKALDAMGRETSALVQPGRTFTITPLERRINQQAAANEKQDLFRNGTFTLVTESEETDVEEVASPNSVTDEQMLEALKELSTGNSIPIEAMIERATSAQTSQRIYEELVLADAKPSLIDMAKAKADQYIEKPTVPVNAIDNVLPPPGQPRRSTGEPVQS